MALITLASVLLAPAPATAGPRGRLLLPEGKFPYLEDWQFSDDGRFFALQSNHFEAETHIFHAWDTSNTRLVARWRLRTMQQFALAPRTTEVAVVTGERQRRGIGVPFAVTVRDLYTGRVRRTIIAPRSIDAAIYTVAWSPDGCWLATGSGDGLARVWDVAGGRRVATLAVGGFVQCVRFSRDGRQLAAIGERDNSEWLTLWNWRAKTRLAAAGVPQLGSTVNFAPGGRRLAVSSGQSQSQVYLAPSLRLQATVPHRVVAFARDGKRIALAARRHILVRGGALPRRALTTTPTVLAMHFTPRGRLLWVTATEQPNGWWWVAPRLWRAPT